MVWKNRGSPWHRDTWCHSLLFGGFTITYYHFPWHANLSMYAITQNYSEGRLSGIHEKKIVVIVRVRQLQQPMRIMRSEFLRDQAKGTQYWNSFFIEHESYSRLLITEKIVLFCPGEMISGASNCKICKCHRVSHWKGVNSHTIYRYL